jgi:hypothetical protein
VVEAVVEVAVLLLRTVVDMQRNDGLTQGEEKGIEIVGTTEEGGTETTTGIGVRTTEEAGTTGVGGTTEGVGTVTTTETEEAAKIVGTIGTEAAGIGRMTAAVEILKGKETETETERGNGTGTGTEIETEITETVTVTVTVIAAAVTVTVGMIGTGTDQLSFLGVSAVGSFRSLLFGLLVRDLRESSSYALTTSSPPSTRMFLQQQPRHSLTAEQKYITINTHLHNQQCWRGKAYCVK